MRADPPSGVDPHPRGRFARQRMFVTSAGDRVDAPDIAVVVTDGVSTVNAEMTPGFARDAHRDVSPVCVRVDGVCVCVCGLCV